MELENSRKKLKGGSLSGTYLISENNIQFVRKEVSLTENREYGFQRWYSQLKRLQRYSILYPGLFPEIINYGKSRDLAFFDMPYIRNTITAHEFLIQTTDTVKVKCFFDNLIDVCEKMYSVKIPSSAGSVELYINEEIEQRINDSLANNTFSNFLKYETVVFNGEEIPAFIHKLDEYKSVFKDVYVGSPETFTHGNLTLENILYNDETDTVYFIDPYEENIIDSSLADFSQVLQSSNAKYEIYNGGVPQIQENVVQMAIPQSPGLDHFNELFIDFIRKTFDSKDYQAIRLFEISQFIRMIPFKMAIDEPKMIFFYCLASKLFNDFKVKN